MPTDRDLALVKAALEAAARHIDAHRYGMPDRESEWSRLIMQRLDALDPAAIVASQHICLVCGRTEPCELNKMETTPTPFNTQDTWPGSPCTFDPTPQELYEENRRLRDELAALRALVAELEHALDAEQLGAEKAQARIAELEQEIHELCTMEGRE